MEPQGAVPVGPGDGSAERGPALCSQVPAKAAPVHAAHQQHRRAGDWVLQGEGGVICVGVPSRLSVINDETGCVDLSDEPVTLSVCVLFFFLLWGGAELE